LDFLVGEAEKDGDSDPLGGGGEAGEHLVEIFHGGAFTGTDRQEEELETKYGDQHEHGLSPETAPISSPIFRSY